MSIAQSVAFPIGEAQRIEYSRRIAGRIAGMQLLWKAIRDDAAADEDFVRLVRTARGLAGSAIVLGFDQLGQEARTLERRLGTLAHRQPSPELGEAIAASIDRLNCTVGL